MQRPTAEQDIYFRALVNLLYVVWILKSKKDGKVRNVSKWGIIYLTHLWKATLKK